MERRLASIISPRKPAHESDEDATTAYSSWHDDSSASQLSSCHASSCLACRLGSRYDGGEGDDDVESQRSCRECLVSRSFESLGSCSTQGAEEGAEEGLIRRLSGSGSSSYYSAVSAQTDEPDDHELSGASFSFEMGPLQYSKSELTESTVSSNSDELDELAERAHHMLQREQSFGSETSGYSCDDVRQDSVAHSAIDTTCRSRMLEWSFKVLEFSFPYESSPRQDAKHPRKYSTETLHTISKSFLLIDRLASRHVQEHGRPMDRSAYKLTCMACLHLVAKTSGLFSLYDSERERAAEEEQPSYSASNCSPPSPSALQGQDTPCQEGQTILPTPKLDPSKSDRPRCTRPALALLSLPGLVALCQNECTVPRLVEAERTVLRQLDWRISGATSVDWCEWLLDMLAACADACETDVDLEDVRDCAIAGLERAMEGGTAVSPSLAAWAAVSSALDECANVKNNKALASMYKRTVSDILCYSEEELAMARIDFYKS
jgi:hypothetical protein